MLAFEVDLEPLIELHLCLRRRFDAIGQLIEIRKVALLAILAAVGLVGPLLHLLVELDLVLHRFALLQQFIYLNILVLAEILPSHFQ